MQRPSSSDRFSSAGDGASVEGASQAPRESQGAAGVLSPVVHRPRWTLFQPRVAVGLVLVAGAIVWAIARGLQYYGVTPVDLAYDLDQPPGMLLLVGAWLWYRSRRR